MVNNIKMKIFQTKLSLLVNFGFHGNRIYFENLRRKSDNYKMRNIFADYYLCKVIIKHIDV